MTIDDQLLDRLERLSQLKIAPEKRGEMGRHLSDILSFVEKLNELDTSHIDEISSAIGGNARLREDIPIENKEVFEELIKRAPKAGERSFIVPRVVG
ncbi:MAG: Asp-tRNA(Asn)/Glu-tRNA(Gln) amidotransferase subunit GatC [Helicobacteraceae bacterium]|jgi:aspartyl-tRNA(Asn)/glutamyl-tRNA(Gln) amidotransferase subunit C|nr:Asp-tRNA(Asn)/Glu-tRNA(Gln) amidotransferase subunit GatC [Helicobacteraceae bacterium]